VMKFERKPMKKGIGGLRPFWVTWGVGYKELALESRRESDVHDYASSKGIGNGYRKWREGSANARKNSGESGCSEWIESEKSNVNDLKSRYSSWVKNSDGLLGVLIRLAESRTHKGQSLAKRKATSRNIMIRIYFLQFDQLISPPFPFTFHHRIKKRTRTL